MSVMIPSTGQHTLFRLHDADTTLVTFIPLDVQVDTRNGDQWMTLIFTVDSGVMVGQRLATALATEQPLVLAMQWYVPVETCKRYLCRVRAFTCDPATPEPYDRVVVTAQLMERL